MQRRTNAHVAKRTLKSGTRSSSRGKEHGFLAKAQRISTFAIGRPLWTITTPSARFVYDQRGGGLASILDRDGKDWIRHSAEGGARGQYRRIPNLIHPEGGFHPGDDRCVSRLEVREGAVAALRSETTDATDSFWSMERSMTVFGFGRSLQTGARWHHLREVPSRFVVGFVESVEGDAVGAAVAGWLRP